MQTAIFRHKLLLAIQYVTDVNYLGEHAKIGCNWQLTTWIE